MLPFMPKEYYTQNSLCGSFWWGSHLMILYTYSESQKAADRFMEAVPSMTSEEFLIKLLRPHEDNLHHMEVLYYLKVRVLKD